jgi:hypothetical protein
MRAWFRLGSILGVSMMLFAACSGGGGGGCGSGGLGKIKGGFPVDKRAEGAVQLRLTKGLFDFIEANAKGIIDALLPPTGIPVPSSCGGDTEICCGQMCKVMFGFSQLKIDPAPPSTLRVTIRTKLKADPDFKVKIPVVGKCDLRFDTTRKGRPDIGLVLPVLARTNGETKLANIDFDTGGLDIQDLDNDDIEIRGGFLCDTADFFKGLFMGRIRDLLKDQLGKPLAGVFCQKCANKDECSSLADQGCMSNKCMRKGTCMQQLGVEGRLDLSASLPGGSGGMDIYAVAGGYTDVEAAPTSGLSMGMLGGAVATSRSVCAPTRPAPTRPPGSQSKAPAFAGNTAPNGKPYHVGAGLSTLELDLLGHGFYESGGLCLAIGTEQVELLSTATLGVLIPSLSDLTRGVPSALKIAVRPQHAPTFVMGKGTFKTEMGKRVIDDPLLHLKVKDLALDFYVYIDERQVRFMRQTLDLDVPLALDVDGKGKIIPMLGDLTTGFSNVRVSDSALLKETPAQLAGLLPSLLPLVLGAVGPNLGEFELPDLMGMKLEPVQITSAPDKTGKLEYLGLFLGIKPAMMPLVPDLMSVEPGAVQPVPKASPSETQAELVELSVPSASALRTGSPVRATLKLDAQNAQPGRHEWQLRVDGGLWQPFDPKPDVTVEDAVLRLPGTHTIEVRARLEGVYDSLDATPAKLTLSVAPALDPGVEATTAEKTGAAGSVDVPRGGCSMGAAGLTRSGSLGIGGLLVALLAVFGLARRGRPSRFTLLGLAAASGAVLGAGSNVACQGNKLGGNGMEGDGPKGYYSNIDEVGRYQSAVARDGKIYIAAYNSNYGDLAYAEVSFDEAQTAKVEWYPADGLPSGEPNNKSKDGFRGGYDDAGDDVGRFTALALTSKGTPIVAYQDVTNGTVKLAARPDREKPWQTSTISAATDGKAGFFNSLVLDDADVPTVAYMIAAQRKDEGKFVSQLVIAKAGSADPTGAEGWQKAVIEEAPVSCAGLCDMGEACVYSDPTKKDRLATQCKKTESGCMPGCKNTQACFAGKCVDALGTPPASKPEGTGLYARLIRSSSGPQVVFHNANTGAVKLAAAPDWKVVTVDGGDGKLRVGDYIGAAAAADGTVHIAYGHRDGQLLYRAWKDGTGSKVEVVDSGVRDVGGVQDVHFVGAGVQLFLDGDQPVVVYQDQTANSLDAARRGMSGWTRQGLSMTPDKSRGFYPQAVSHNGRFLIVDVVYDRMADALSGIAFSPL